MKTVVLSMILLAGLSKAQISQPIVMSAGNPTASSAGGCSTSATPVYNYVDNIYWTCVPNTSGAIGVGAWTQSTSPELSVQQSASTPSGTCNAKQVAIKTPDGAIYTCQNGTYGLISALVSGVVPVAQLPAITSDKIPAVNFGAPAATHTFVNSQDLFVCTTTCTITVPAPMAGVQYCVLNDDNVSTVITLSAIGSAAMYENQARTAYGTAATGTLVSGGAAKDQVCLLGRDSTHYITNNAVGTWAAN